MLQNRQIMNMNVLSVSVEGTNATGILEVNGIPMQIRIHYTIEKIGRSESMQPRNIYFEGLRIDTGYYTGTYEIAKIVDAGLYIERNASWLLEEFMRIHTKRNHTRS